MKEYCSGINEKDTTDNFATAQLYAQKFLSYLIAYISTYIVYLTIIFEGHRSNSILLMNVDFKVFSFPFYILLALPFFVLLTSFGFYTYRTFVEMYAIEKEIKTIVNVKEMVDLNIQYWVPFYEITRRLTVPREECSGWEGRTFVIWFFLIIIFISILFALMLINSCVWILVVLLFVILLKCDLCLRKRKSKMQVKEE